MSSSKQKSRSSLDLNSVCGPIHLRVVNHELTTVATGTESLKVELPAGEYQVEMGLGEWRETRSLTLQPGEAHRDHQLSMDFPTAFPVGRLDDWESTQLQAVSTLSHEPAQQLGSGGGLLVFARYLDAEEVRKPATLSGMELWSGDGVRIMELADAQRQESAAGWAGTYLEVRPGAYRLRWYERRLSRWSDDELIQQEQAVWISPDWVTGFFFHVSPYDGRPNMTGMSVHMRRVGEGFEGYAGDEERRQNLASELALESLRSGEPFGMVQREILELILHAKYQDPMLGIVGAYALLGERQQRWSVFDTVVRNLFKILSGHPDVRALRWLGKLMREGEDKTHTRSDALAWPPMIYDGCMGVLERSWDEENVVVRNSLLEQLGPHLQHRGPWTAWEVFYEEPMSLSSEFGDTGGKTRGLEDNPTTVLNRVWQELDEASLRKFEPEAWGSAEYQVGRFIAQRKSVKDSRVTFADLRETGLSRDLVTQALRRLEKKLQY